MMARAKRKPKPEPELEVDPRDFVMARLAAGRAAAQAAINAIDESLNLFVNPDEDKSGNERTTEVAEALEALGVACRAIESAEAMLDDVDFSEGEPWEEIDDEDDEEDDDEEEEGD